MHMGTHRVKDTQVQTVRSDFVVIRMKDDESVDDFFHDIKYHFNRYLIFM